MFDETLRERARRLLAACAERGVRIATAESCTGGLIAALLTDIPGSSSVFERGFVTYSNPAKTDLLGVPATLVAAEGAVSRAVALAMAEGALQAAGVEVAVSVTGVAGPGGGSDAKPIGLVHFGLAVRGAPTMHRVERYGDLGRSAVRTAAVGTALDLLAQAASTPQAGAAAVGAAP